MTGWLALIPAAWRRWLAAAGAALVAATIIAGQARTILRLRADGREARRRIETLRKAEEIEDEVDALDRGELDRRLSRWMRR